jgi:hypothetical protein
MLRHYFGRKVALSIKYLKLIFQNQFLYLILKGSYDYEINSLC